MATRYRIIRSYEKFDQPYHTDAGPVRIDVLRVSITSLDRAGTLQWNNRMLPAQPIYDVIQAGSPSGPWSHLAYVTNVSVFQLPSPPEQARDPAFFEVAWIGDSPLEFDYVFDEGYGVPAVAGHISFPLLPQNGAAFGSWSLDEVIAVDGFHPVGVGQMRRIQWLPDDGLRVWLTGPVEGVSWRVRCNAERVAAGPSIPAILVRCLRMDSPAPCRLGSFWPCKHRNPNDERLRD